MKKILILSLGVFLFSCSQENPEAIKKQIISSKNKVNSLNQKIAELEKQLEADSTYSSVDRGTVVTIKDLAPEPFYHYITVSGKVLANEEAFISPEINGQISGIYVEEGQRVKSGQTLISLNTDITEKSIQEVKTSLELLTKLYEKQKELWDQEIGTEVQYLQAKTNMESAEARLATLEEQLDMANIKAPFSGIVEDIMVKEGEMAMPGARLIHLVNLKDLSIEADVSEVYLDYIAKGEKVEVGFPSYPEMNKQLPIVRVGSVIENMSRTFQVELQLKNPDEKVKPNQLATLRINDYSEESAIIIPSLIIKQDITGYYVFIIEAGEEGKQAKKIYVEPGRTAGDQTMINKGLEPGMQVIVDGFNLVKNGMTVNVVSQ